jgi:hypothetical protein
MLAEWLDRQRAGNSASSVWPSISLPGRPNMRCAAALKTTMRSFASTVMMPSMAESTMPSPRRRSDSSARSACLRAVMSRPIPR